MDTVESSQDLAVDTKVFRFDDTGTVSTRIIPDFNLQNVKTENEFSCEINQEVKVEHEWYFVAKNEPGKYEDTYRAELSESEVNPAIQIGNHAVKDGVTKAIVQFGNHQLHLPEQVGTAVQTETESPKAEITCGYCRQVLETEEALKQHVDNHVKEKPFYCEPCNVRFKLHQSLEIHIDRHHRAQRKPHKCPVCRKGFHTIKRMNLHQKLHENHRFPCEECDKTFRSHRFLRRHIANSHRVQKPAISCHACGETFESKDKLSKHFGEKHVEMIRHRCEECGQGFLYRTDLILHLKLHAYERPFPCDQCHKCYPTKEGLTLHAMVHTNEKPYKCTKCPSTFCKKSSMVSHMAAIHDEGNKSNPRPQQKRVMSNRFVCDQCNEGFSMQRYLVNHKLTHNGQALYKCEDEGCQMSFTRKAYFIQHRNTHSNKPSLICPHCQRVFVKAGFFNRHVATHSLIPATTNISP